MVGERVLFGCSLVVMNNMCTVINIFLITSDWG